MSSFKLDGKEIPFEPGDTIIRAAWRKGIEIPHYCWHPGLSVAANCRMCLIEVTSGRPMMMPILQFDAVKNAYVPATKPKLQPACQTAACEGLEVSSQSEDVKRAQSSVQEFLLLNHPVDCPICDQAGECRLQDYWMEHQHKLKRKKTEPVHKPKGVRFGETIVYDAERCVMCTRCIRFCDEVAKDHVLDMRERGNRNEIVLAPGRQLDHRYTLMTEHVCPVGALTSRDFRFKARVWFLKTAKSICTGCATGCNTYADYDPRDGKIYRLRPRDNEAVNQYWMCDDGMMTYKSASENRMFSAMVRQGNELCVASTSDVVNEVVQILATVPKGKLGIVLSAQHSNEDNAALIKLGALFDAKIYLAALGDWQGDDILRSADQNPNRAGAMLVAGHNEVNDIEDLITDVLAGELESVIALGAVAEQSPNALQSLSQLKMMLSLTSHQGDLPSKASYIIPVTSVWEMRGTFVNKKQIEQTFDRVVPPFPGIEPAYQVLKSLSEQLERA